MRRLLLLGLIFACSSSSSSGGAPVVVDPPTKPTAEQSASADALLTGPDWYRHAVFYEVFLRSFQDSNGDGIGDIQGLISRLDYLKDLGVDALWLMPMYPTPFKDSGYDIADYRAINPDYGTMADFDQLVAQAHQRKMRVFIDLVLNHTSDQHAWFQESRKDKTNPKASWYVWSDTASRADLGTCGSAQESRFGVPWTLDAPRNQYFFHRYYKEQPDLDYRNPEVVAETLDMVKFWISDKQVDGYRADVIGQLFESPQGCTMIPETQDYIRKLRGVLDAQPDKAMVAESSVLTDSTSYFGNGKDMFHMAFDFGFGYFWGIAFGSASKQIVESAIKTTATYPAGAQPAQVIGSHDVPRAWTSSGGVEWRYRNAALLSMTLRGTPFIYYGEEVGIRPGAQVIVDERDAQRTPMTWTGAAGHGFTTGNPWIAFGPETETTAVDAQDASKDSMLHYYRQLLAFRRGHSVWGTGDVELVSLDSEQAVSFIRKNADETYYVVSNLSEDDITATADNVPSPATLVFGNGSVDGKTVKIPGKAAAVFKVR